MVRLCGGGKEVVEVFVAAVLSVAAIDLAMFKDAWLILGLWVEEIIRVLGRD